MRGDRARLAALTAVLVGLLTTNVVDAYACKSPKGEDVDWFYALKLPNLKRAENGTEFIYVDSSSGPNNGFQWLRSAQTVENAKSNIGRTISQIFTARKKKKNFFAVYNDEDANTNKTEFSRGHMKGVLVFDNFSGVWFIHSVPRFPRTTNDTYAYPHTGKRYGQSFLCVTFPTHLLNDIGIQLQFAQPVVYDKQLPNSYAKLYPNLAKALDRKTSRLPKNDDIYASVCQLTSVSGMAFTSFTKSTKFGKDLYSDLVAAQLNTSMYVETWLNGGPDLPSDCGSKFKVYNLRSIHPDGDDFNNNKDHSKWAVSKSINDSWICVGDINRQPSQFRRGGGTMCLQHTGIAELFRKTAGDVECCPSSLSGEQDASVAAKRFSYTLLPSPTDNTTSNVVAGGGAPNGFELVAVVAGTRTVPASRDDADQDACVVVKRETVAI